MAELEESTDGWAAALQLASLSLRDHADPAALIEHLSGRDEALGEYLASNVLGQPLNPTYSIFCCRPASPNRSAADWPPRSPITGVVEAVLEEIEKRDLFYGGLTPRGTWFQYHHPFAEYLLHRLERDAEDRYQNYTAGRRSGLPNTTCSARPSIT